MSRASQGERQRASAAEVFAMAHGAACGGPDLCHYCGTACERAVPHREPVPLLLGRTDKAAEYARLPGNQYLCVGCQIFRRPRVSVAYLGGGVRDSTSARKHAWYVTPGGAWAVGPFSGRALHERLLKPAPRFFLMLTEGAAPPDSLLQLAVCNDNDEIDAGTKLHFTVNGTPHHYTVYEYEQAAARGTQGREPGASALIRILGEVPKELIGHVDLKDDVKEKGRPTGPGADPRTEQPKRVLRKAV